MHIISINFSLHGQLTNEFQNGTAIARTYDALNRPTGYRLMRNGGASPPGEPLAVSYAYDALGRLASVTAGRDALVASAAFAYTRLPGTDLVSGYVASAGDSGGVASRPLLVRSVAYEPRRDLVSAVANSFDLSTFQPSNLSTFAYANDAAGRRSSITRTGAAFGALAGASDAYGYNARSEVVSARRTLGNNEVRGFDYDYAYDPIGNRVSATYYDEQGEAVASAYTANALNQYTSRTVPGNVQVRGEADTGAVVTVNENPTWRYPNLGGPAAPTSPQSGATSAAPAAQTSYFYGGDYADNATFPVFKEVEIAAVVPASSPDGWDEMSAVTGRVFVAQNPERFTYDANGNVSEYVTTNGTIVAHYDYSPFGETLIESGVLASTFTHRFSTKPWCPVTRLYEYQMRKYRPGIGHWLSRDPIGELGGMHQYAFTDNLIGSYYDILGLKPNVSRCSEETACGALATSAFAKATTAVISSMVFQFSPMNPTLPIMAY